MIFWLALSTLTIANQPEPIMGSHKTIQELQIASLSDLYLDLRPHKAIAPVDRYRHETKLRGRKSKPAYLSAERLLVLRT